MSSLASVWRIFAKGCPARIPCSAGVRYSTASSSSDEVRFDSPQAVAKGKSTWEVFRGWLVFKMFSYDMLVDNGAKLYNFSKRVFGRLLTGKILKATVLGQFAGGLDESDADVVAKNLATRNISTIWFFSIERDLKEVPVPGSLSELEEQESVFDEINHRYLKSIEMSASSNCNRALRFAAVKLTAIVNPHLLNKLDSLLVGSENVFLSLASPGKYTVDRSITPAHLHKELPALKLEGTLPNGNIGIADWTRHFSVAHDLQRFQSLDSAVSPMEEDQHRRFVHRLQSIGKLAESMGVCVLVDAEQTCFQSAIEHLTLHLLSVRHNTTHPLFYNTLQAYLKKSYDMLLTYLETAKHYGIKSGVKLVRGCNIEHERAHAKNGINPIHDSKSLTDASYYMALERLLAEEVRTGAASIMVASHNKESVKRALDLIREHTLRPDDGRVCFGQLLGMGDYLTYPLAISGHISNKVVPYGSMDDLMPFLLRRGHENRGMMKNAQEERILYFKELKRRIFSLA